MTAKNVRASQPYFWQNYQTNKSEAKKYIFYMCIALNGFHLTVSFGFCFLGGREAIFGAATFLTRIVYIVLLLLLLLFLIDIYFLWFCFLYEDEQAPFVSRAPLPSIGETQEVKSSNEVRTKRCVRCKLTGISTHFISVKRATCSAKLLQNELKPPSFKPVLQQISLLQVAFGRYVTSDL